MFESNIPEFPNYRVSAQGEVFNRNGIKLKPEVQNNGYLRVSLSNENVKHKRFSVHRLVAQAFIPNPDNLPQVNHLDRDKQNNNASNLEWCTPLDNLKHSRVIEKASEAKFTKVRCITTGEVFNSFKEIEERYGLPHSNLVACCKGRRSTCGGMKWEYV